MSLPSIPVVAAKLGINLTNASEAEQAAVLVEAMKRDVPDALAYLHRKAHEADANGGAVVWTEDPNSPLGKQLTRVHASDALRPLVSKHFCHAKPLTFVNCCGGVVGTVPANILQLQIACQAGPIAYSDC